MRWAKSVKTILMAPVLRGLRHLYWMSDASTNDPWLRLLVQHSKATGEQESRASEGERPAAARTGIDVELN